MGVREIAGIRVLQHECGRSSYVQRPEQELVELCRSDARVCPARRQARAQLLRGAATRDPDATFIPAPGVRRPGPTTALLQPRDRRRMDRHRMAGDDRVRGAQRTHRRTDALQQRRRMDSPRRARAVPDAPTGGGRCRLRRFAPPSTGCSTTRTPAGWWSGELETNVTMTAEHVLLLRFLGVSHDDIREGAIRHILGTQRERRHVGAVPRRPRRPEHDHRGVRRAASARRRRRAAGDAPGAAHDSRAGWTSSKHACSRRSGSRCSASTRGTACRACRRNWCDLPSWAPLNLYDFACWARGTIAPLLIVISRRPVRDLGVDVSEVIAPGAARRMHRVAGSGDVPLARQGAEALRPAAAPAGTRRIAHEARRVDHRAAGGRRRLGRDPATVGVFAHRAAPRGHVARPSGDASRARGVPAVLHRRRATAGVSRHACRRCGTRRGRCSRCAKPGAPRAPVAAARGRLDARRADLRRWRLAGQGAARASAAAGLSSSTTTSIPDVDDTAVVVLALLESGDPRSRGAVR